MRQIGPFPKVFWKQADPSGGVVKPGSPCTLHPGPFDVFVARSNRISSLRFADLGRFLRQISAPAADNR